MSKSSDQGRWRISLSLNRNKKIHRKLIEKLEEDAEHGEFADLIEKILWNYYFGGGGRVVTAAPPAEPPKEEEEKEEKAETDLGSFLL